MVKFKRIQCTYVLWYKVRDKFVSVKAPNIGSIWRAKKVQVNGSDIEAAAGHGYVRATVNTLVVVLCS